MSPWFTTTLQQWPWLSNFELSNSHQSNKLRGGKGGYVCHYVIFDPALLDVKNYSWKNPCGANPPLQVRTALVKALPSSKAEILAKEEQKQRLGL